MKIHTVDAKNRILGRVATEVVHILRGKNSTSFEPNIIPQSKVKITNASAVRLSSASKEETKVYKRFSGYPSGLKQIVYKDMIVEHPERVLEHAIRGMMPKNKMSKKIIRENLIIES